MGGAVVKRWWSWWRQGAVSGPVGNGVPPLSHGLSLLKWLALFLPLAFASLYLHLATGLLHPLSQSLPGFVLLVALLGAAIALFTFAIFGLLERFQRALFQRNREMEALLAVGRQVATSLDLDEVLARALAAAVEATTAEAGEIWLSEEGRRRVVMRRRYGANADAFEERAVFAWEEGVPGIVAATGQPIAIHDLPRDQRFLRQWVKAAGYHTYCAFPLSSRERVVGVMGLAARSPRALTQPEELRLIEAMCDQIAMAVENALLHEQVQRLAVLTERERIARELHDGMAQVLTYVNAKALAVERLLARGDREGASQQLQQMADVARGLYAEVREAILSLRTRPAADANILSVLRHYIEEFQSLSGLPIHFQAPEELALLTPVQEIQLLRIVQEALTNVRQHAQASQARVVLRSGEGGLEVVVEDNGRGFDPRQLGRGDWPRFGLQSMEERARAMGGTLYIQSQPGRGTSVIITIPRDGRGK